MTQSLARSLASLRRRVAVATYLGALSRHVLAALLVGGTAALLLRTLAGLSTADAGLCLLVTLAAPVTAALATRRRPFSREGALTWLDLASGGNGALLTASAVDDPRWRARVDRALERLDRPLRMRLGASGGRVALGAGFVALALLVPAATPNDHGTRFTYQATIDHLREKLETLEEEIEFEDETAAELEERLGRLEDEARDATNPEAVFEAVAELEGRLEDEALEALESAKEAMEHLGDGERSDAAEVVDAREALQKAFETMRAAGLMPKLSKELAEALDLAESLGLPDEMVDWGEKELAELAELADEMPDWGEAIDWGALDVEALAGLSREMQELLAEKMAELADAGLLDMEMVDWGDLANFDLSELGALSLAELAELELCEDCKNGEP